MSSGNEWEMFFDGHAPIYMTNCFTQNTLAEVDFVLEELALPPGSVILDIGCGTGRHSVELAKRGYLVTGVDISRGMLAEARKAALEASVQVQWVHCDATEFHSQEAYDGAICLCEGAFALLGAGDDPIEHDLAVLRCIHDALRPGAKLILTTLNACKKIREHSDADVQAGRFDPVTLAETLTAEWDSSEGKRSVQVRERGYVGPELVWLFGQAGLKTEHIWGGTAGNWGRRKPLLDEFELMVVAARHLDAA